MKVKSYVFSFLRMIVISIRVMLLWMGSGLHGNVGMVHAIKAIG